MLVKWIRIFLMVRIIYNYRRRLGKVRAEVINHVPILEGSMIPINSFHQMKFPEIPNLIDIVQQMDRWLSQTNQKIFTRFSSSSLIFSFLKIPTISVHFIFFFFLWCNFDFHSTRTKVCESINHHPPIFWFLNFLWTVSILSGSWTP